MIQSKTYRIIIGFTVLIRSKFVSLNFITRAERTKEIRKVVCKHFARKARVKNIQADSKIPDRRWTDYGYSVQKDSADERTQRSRRC